MYDDSVIIAFSDNGGDVRTGASNHPFRGDKMTPWEGGTRVAAFMHSANEELLPKQQRGTESYALSHVTDIFTTITSLAGADSSGTPSSSDGGGVSPPMSGTETPEKDKGERYTMDGHNLWNAWTKKNVKSPRTEMIYNIDPVGLAAMASGFMIGNGKNSFILLLSL